MCQGVSMGITALKKSFLPVLVCNVAIKDTHLRNSVAQPTSTLCFKKQHVNHNGANLTRHDNTGPQGTIQKQTRPFWTILDQPDCPDLRKNQE